MDFDSIEGRPAPSHFDPFSLQDRTEFGHDSRTPSTNQSMLQNNATTPEYQAGTRISDMKYNQHSNSAMRSNTLASNPHQGTPAAAAAAAAGWGGEVRTANVVKTAAGFGFTLADTEAGQTVKMVSDSSGRNRLKPGDVIVAIGDADVSRESHATVVTLLKSFPVGSVARIRFIRSDGDRLYRRARSTVPEVLFNDGLLSVPSSSLKARDNVRQHPNFLQRSTSLNPDTVLCGPEDITDKNGAAWGVSTWRNPRTSDPLPPHPPTIIPRSSSLNYTPDASRFQLTDFADPRAEGTQRTIGGLDRGISDRKKSLTISEIQKQYWRSLSSTSSTPNFSGTPDYIPASLYSPPVSVVTRQPFQSYPGDRSRLPNGGSTDLNVRRDARTSTDDYSRMTGRENDQMNSICEDSGIYSFKEKSSMHDNRANQLDNGSLDRMISENHHHHRGQRQHYDNNYATINRATTARAKSKTRVSEEIDNNQKGVLSPADHQISIYNLELHRGSRGFGFSIRGGKEFNGMPLFVLNIAKEGPADTDGRMKNGDQILSINGFDTKGMTHERAISLIQNTTSPIALTMRRT